jgi:hypothetical protein
MPQVLDPVHEVGNGRSRIPVMCGKDLLHWVEFWLFGYYGGFSTHRAHVSIPPIDGGPHHQIFGKLRPGRSSRLFLLCSNY